MDDDEQACLANQQELNERYEDDWQKDYDMWISVQMAWWIYVDSNPDWIKEHGG